MAGGGLGDLMKQAQQMQEKMQQLQQEIANAEVTGESGAGLVKITMTGRHDVRKVDIDASLMSEDKEVLEETAALAGEMGSQLYNFANMLTHYLHADEDEEPKNSPG